MSTTLNFSEATDALKNGSLLPKFKRGDTTIEAEWMLNGESIDLLVYTAKPTTPRYGVSPFDYRKVNRYNTKPGRDCGSMTFAGDDAKEMFEFFDTLATITQPILESEFGDGRQISVSSSTKVDRKKGDKIIDFPIMGARDGDERLWYPKVSYVARNKSGEPEELPVNCDMRSVHHHLSKYNKLMPYVSLRRLTEKEVDIGTGSVRIFAWCKDMKNCTVVYGKTSGGAVPPPKTTTMLAGLVSDLPASVPTTHSDVTPHTQPTEAAIVSNADFLAKQVRDIHL